MPKKVIKKKTRTTKKRVVKKKVNINDKYEDTLEIFWNQGVEPTFQYIYEELVNNSDYGTIHFIMHELGHQVWHVNEDLDYAWSFIPE